MAFPKSRNVTVKIRQEDGGFLRTRQLGCEQAFRVF